MTINKNIYNTSQDERGYISVYEFTSSNGTIVMWDSECGYVNWTSIRKAMGWSKRGEGRNIMKEMENVEKTAKDIRKIRGGILKIQGTWIPFDDAYEAAKEYCYSIRYELTQIFGEQFAKEARPKAPSAAQPTKKRTKHQKHNSNNANALGSLKFNINELTPPPSDIDSYSSSSASSSAVSTATNTPISLNKNSSSKFSTTITGTSRKRRTSISENGISTERKRRRSHPKVNANKTLVTHSNSLNSSMQIKNSSNINNYNNNVTIDPNNHKKSYQINDNYNMNSCVTQRQDWENIHNNSNNQNNMNNSNMGRKIHHQVNINTIDANQIFEAVETALALQTLSMDLGMRPFPAWMNIQSNEYKKCHDYPKLTYPSEFEMAGCRFEMIGGCYQKVC